MVAGAAAGRSSRRTRACAPSSPRAAPRRAQICSTVSFRPSSMFQITSGLSWSRLVRSSAALLIAKSKARSTWKHSCASLRSGCASSTMAPASAKRCGGLAGDGGDFGIDRGDAEIGRIGDALRLVAGARGRQERGRQHRQRQRIGRDARRSWHRAAAQGPRHCAPSGPGRRDCGRSRRPAYARRGRCSAACRRCRRSSRGCAASRPCRSRARARPCRLRAPPPRRRRSRPRSATVSQGLRVAPNTSLKVLAPAPNSGVLDLA